MESLEAAVAATAQGYDAVAPAYAAHAADELAAMPFLRAMLGAFAELVSADGGAVLDLGCGPGFTTAFLADRGLAIAGIDIAPGMVAEARRRHPALTFRVGSLLAIDVADASLAAAVAAYSLIHVPPDHHPTALAELARVIRSGGHVFLAFQSGTGVRRTTEAFGHRVAVDSHRLDPERTAATMIDAGFEVVARLDRAPSPDELTPHGVLIGRRVRPTSAS